MRSRYPLGNFGPVRRAPLAGVVYDDSWGRHRTHSGHSAARSFYRRPFTSIAEMDRVMIDRWNAVVGTSDELWDLGDFAVRQSAERVASLLRVLNGQKHLITGNNDDATVTNCDGWQSVQPYAEVTVDGTGLVLCHYPFRTWHDMGRGAINLHGHSHGKLKPLPRQFDVGVDVRDFQPVQLAEIVGKAKVRSPDRTSTLDTGSNGEKEA
jgi:calcineurin-like phosphoesterase family protein